MKIIRFILIIALVCVVVIAPTEEMQAAPAPVHTWKSIEYPPLPVPGLEAQKLTVSVGSGGGHEESHLRFDIMWSALRDAPWPPIIADAGKFVVRLHLSDGTIVLPKPEKRPPSWRGGGSMVGMTWSLIYIFPWQRNLMDEAWIEFVLPGQTYWIELPYGFTRNPADVLPSDTKHSEPVFPSTMKALGEKDRLVPWLNVNYDLGEIQNGWRLSLKLANPLDAQAEAILYRDDSRAGESMFRWKLDTPQTAIEIKTQAGRILAAHAMGIHLHKDGMRRSDEYSFNRYPAGGRDWGTVAIQVDNETYKCLVPSSLFKYLHGVTDNNDSNRLPRPTKIQDR